ncbi:hypothetical protein N665_0692s0011 [Sinapis alba]|nr:hypothetical protein N665_0692s0011 [Sinapis alba]
MKDAGSSSSAPVLRDCQKFCHCGIIAPVRKSWTNKKPGRLFYGCARYKEDRCNFFEWHDEGEVHGWPKRSLIAARDEIRMKSVDLKRLKTKVAKLHAELQKQSITEDKEKKHEVVNATKRHLLILQFST